MTETNPSDELRDCIEKIISGDTSHLVAELKTISRQIERGETSRAVWRLVDLAGALAEIAASSGAPIQGWSSPTGRGYQIVKKR